MKKYYATQDIGDYSVGDEVPAQKAKIWCDMYVVPPVRIEIIDDPIIKSNELDLNKDGKVDEKDGKIASQVLNSIKSSKGKGGK